MAFPWGKHQRKPRQFPLSLGFSRYSLEFATNNYVHIPYSASMDALTALTIQAFVHPRTIPADYSRIFEKDWVNPGAIFIGARSNGRLNFEVQNDIGIFGQAQSAVPDVMPLGRTTHIEAWWDGINVKVFLNGVERGTGAFAGTLTNNQYSRVGANRAGATGWDGFIDEFLFYNRAITPLERRRNILDYHNPSRNGLVCWLRMEEGSGLTANDQSGQGNNGSLLPVLGPPLWTRNRMWQLRSEAGL